MKKFLLYTMWIFSISLFLVVIFAALGLFLLSSNWEIKNYAILLVILTISVILFLICDKKFKARHYYTKLECIYFYQKCKQAGIIIRHFPLSNVEKNKIKEFAETTSYFSCFDVDTLAKIIKIGFDYEKSKR